MTWWQCAWVFLWPHWTTNRVQASRPADETPPVMQSTGSTYFYPPPRMKKKQWPVSKICTFETSQLIILCGFKICVPTKQRHLPPHAWRWGQIASPRRAISFPFSLSSAPSISTLINYVPDDLPTTYRQCANKRDLLPSVLALPISIVPIIYKIYVVNVNDTLHQVKKLMERRYF